MSSPAMPRFAVVTMPFYEEPPFAHVHAVYDTLAAARFFRRGIQLVVLFTSDDPPAPGYRFDLDPSHIIRDQP